MNQEDKRKHVLKILSNNKEVIDSGGYDLEILENTLSEYVQEDELKIKKTFNTLKNTKKEDSKTNSSMMALFLLLDYMIPDRESFFSQLIEEKNNSILTFAENSGFLMLNPLRK